MRKGGINLKGKLKDPQHFSVGSWITLGHEGIAEIMCQAGFDWVCVDLEHTTIGIEKAGQLIRVIELAGCAPLIRLSSNDPVQIKRVMDGGAHGIIVPMVNSREDVDKAYRAMQYPPKGKRGVGLARAQGYGKVFEEYRKNLDRSVLIVQIEHKDSIENLEEILTSPEVDGYIVGPYDLSASYGLPGDFAHPEFMNAMAKINEIGKKSLKAGGLHIVEPKPELLVKARKDGMRFVAYSVDIRILEQGCARGMTALKEMQ